MIRGDSFPEEGVVSKPLAQVLLFSCGPSDMPYHAYPSLYAAMRSHLQTLAWLGRQESLPETEPGYLGLHGLA